jgi:cell division protein FtsW
LLLGAQAVANMGVVMGLLPPKGLTLPMVSYGGSSLVVSMLSIGLLLALSRTVKR